MRGSFLFPLPVDHGGVADTQPCARRESRKSPYFIEKIRSLADRESSVEPMQLDRRSRICHGLEGPCFLSGGRKRRKPRSAGGRRSIDPTRPLRFIPGARRRAPVAELVDAPDSKSGF